MLKLVFPSENHEKLWNDIIAEFERENEKIIPFALKNGMIDYMLYLTRAINMHKNIGVPAHLVPSTIYFLMDENETKIIGAVDIRHWLNENLLLQGGNIGYGIRPSERRKGYATQMLFLALEKCKELNIKKALVTCDKGNLSSSKVILNNGGILINEVKGENGETIQRYWIKTK